MKKSEKKEKPTPKKCVCGAAPITVKARAGHMVTCPDLANCSANMRSAWQKNLDLAIADWNTQVDSFISARR